MELGLNTATPQTLHVDLNSCFATIEQQARPHLRGKPIAVAAYVTPRGCVLTASYEAKAYGVKTGMRVMEAQALCPQIIVLPPDPDKYLYIHHGFKKILSKYTPDLEAKSIDEFVLNLRGTDHKTESDLIALGIRIKRELREGLGSWLKCNVGIGTNRFLAKLAASLHKPDGLDVISHQSLRSTYAQLGLRDLHGINFRNEARLNRWAIKTPLEFLGSDVSLLRGPVFHSIVGYYWYVRLRGWEIDAERFKRRTFGQSYALPKYTASDTELSQLMMKLCEKMGRRLRKHGSVARGIHVWSGFADHSSWHKGKSFKHNLYATQELFATAMSLYRLRPSK